VPNAAVCIVVAHVRPLRLTRRSSATALGTRLRYG
jgi:hypothetical protein